MKTYWDLAGQSRNRPSDCRGYPISAARQCSPSGWIIALALSAMLLFSTASSAKITIWDSDTAFAAGSSVSIPRPALATEGDWLIAQVTTRSDTDDILNIDTVPVGWHLFKTTVIAQEDGTGAQVAQGVYGKLMTSIDAEPWTYEWSATGASAISIGVLALSGVDPNAPVIEERVASGKEATTAIAPSVNAEADALLLTLFGLQETASAFQPPGGMREEYREATSLLISGNYETHPHIPTTGVRSVAWRQGRAWIAHAITLRAAAPVVASVGPINGSTLGGTLVTLIGQHFLDGATVTIGGVNCTSPTVVSDTRLTCITGPASVGLVNVEVTNRNGLRGMLTSGFEYIAPPVISGITPAQGPSGGGTAVIIEGLDFRKGATVKIGGVPCATVRLVGTTQIGCTTGSGTGGFKDVVVTNPDQQTGTLSAGFEYQPPPDIVSIAPAFGPGHHYTRVSITGAGFLPEVAVRIGAINCKVIGVTPTRVDCITMPHDAGNVDVVITDPYGRQDTLANGYYYQPVPVAPIPTLPAGGMLLLGGALIGLFSWRNKSLMRRWGGSGR